MCLMVKWPTSSEISTEMIWIKGFVLFQWNVTNNLILSVYRVCSLSSVSSDQQLVIDCCR